MSTEPTVFDLAVIGSGPGGYVSAIKASQLGLKVALVEKYPRLGGTCLHWGCIPTKTLLVSAYNYDKAKHASEYGITCRDLAVDLRLVKARKDKIIKKLSMGIDFLMKKNKITVFHGKASFCAPEVIRIQGESFAEIRARKTIIATGSEAKLIPGIELDGRAILGSREILELDNVPKSMLVVGAGTVGIEFASIFSSFDCDVTVIEMLPRILPQEDPEISQEMRKLLEKRRIKVWTDARLEEMKVVDDNVHSVVSISGAETKKLVTEKALIAIGRKPVSEDIGLEKLGVATSGGYILVDAHMQTNLANIFAIGDVVPTKGLAHVASHEGIHAVEYIGGQRTVPINYELVPNCTFSQPEVASVGLTEPAAKERGFDLVTSKFPFAAVSKASILGENEGFVKLVSERKYKQILGVHMVGPCVTELIMEGAALIGLEATAAEVSHFMHPHPTVSEGIMEAAHALYSGVAIHI